MIFLAVFFKNYFDEFCKKTREKERITRGRIFLFSK